MIHKGKARLAGLRILFLGLLCAAIVFGVLAWTTGATTPVLGCGIAVYAVFACFTLYFFRDPDAPANDEPAVLLSPAHGKVDMIDEIEEPVVMRGSCRRVSIFLSVFDVHVQQAPASGRVTYTKHTPGKFLNAMSADSGLHNENVLIGFELKDEPGVKVGVGLIAGLIARRILPWIALNDTVARGQRISMIQFGSRCDLYFPKDYEVRVALGARVVGGETVVAVKKAP